MKLSIERKRRSAELQVEICVIQEHSWSAESLGIGDEWRKETDELFLCVLIHGARDEMVRLGLSRASRGPGPHRGWGLVWEWS